MFLTPELITELADNRAQVSLLQKQYYYHFTSVEEKDEITAKLTALQARLDHLLTLERLENEYKKVEPFIALYPILKPISIELSAKALDEAIDILLQVCNKLTRIEEVRTAVAQATWATYQSYITAGFTEDQAFTITLRMAQIFDETLKNSITLSQKK